MTSAERAPVQHGTSRLLRAPGLPDEIARMIAEEVGNGRLKPGDRLPTEHSMCEAYGVSRAVVREAISRLKHDGLLISQQGRGVFVSPEGASSSFRLPTANLDDPDDLRQMLELLISIEVAATGLAAERRGERDLREIDRALRDMAMAIERGESGVDEDVRFHSGIVEASGNVYFKTFTAYLEARVRNLIRAARMNTARFEGLAYKVQEEHEAIFRAIAAQDVAAAREAAERHLRNAAARLQLYISDDARKRSGRRGADGQAMDPGKDHDRR